ncbi:16S rRNA (cytidine(1402)-2'-O)-methyltransferase [Candidatus Berkiella aquae]|uniref:Ribosomal RNA small subunit methyltransferase I n=1 Tax=Candidatus Berkiella aquae TaxID=295108 RepID=A0A0Q9YSV3_9GAMM|nr:16S rRNA (cytidine(1402)-2'-O)-methyltransferase [Candidatus Berkiella aquae]MCS5710796.1 16S rRNA (cytidine(1402)-2'-O)-methyltransferase [Candidatus Berkiella aquae]
MQKMGKLYVVATPIGNLTDLSQRAQDVLSQVTWIAAEDTRHSLGLLQHLGIATPLVSYHEHNERERSLALIEKLMSGEDGALISDAGTPLISDPGYHLVQKAHEAGIQVVPIPGACAAIAALSASGLASAKFLFEGFLPAKSGRRKRLAQLKDFPATVIFYEAPHRVLELLEECCDEIGRERSACLAKEITKKFETIYSSSLENILARVRQGEIPLKGEFVLMIAPPAEKPESLSEVAEQIRILQILMAELPMKQAVQLAVKLTGHPKNALYELALEIQGKK